MQASLRTESDIVKRFLIFVLIVGGAWLTWPHREQSRIPAPGVMTAEQIQSLARTVQAEEVVMYSTTECAYCAQARAWMARYDFAFTECNMSVKPRCQDEFNAYGANGTPYLVIRRHGKEHHMKDGFDSEEFLAALQN